MLFLSFTSLGRKGAWMTLLINSKKQQRGDLSFFYCPKNTRWKPNICQGIFVTSATWKSHSHPHLPPPKRMKGFPIFCTNSVCDDEMFETQEFPITQCFNPTTLTVFFLFALSPPLYFNHLWEAVFFKVLSGSSQALSPSSKIATHGSSRCGRQTESLLEFRISNKWGPWNQS